MSTKYTGGFITKSPVAPTSSAASGIWTLDQQQQAQKAGTWPAPPNYIEEVFSTYLYTGNGVGYPSGPTINNGIDLAGKGGMVWGKARSSAFSNWVYDTARGVGDALTTNGTDAEYAGGATAGVNSFNSNGFGFGDNVYNENSNGVTYVSWTFRKQPKFFDIVTYTGNGTSGRTVAHNLGSVPGCIIVKRLDLGTQWYVYHRSLGATKFLELAAVADASTGAYAWNDTEPTSSVFSVGNGSSVNTNGATYVAYLFAHNAGGFGLTGTDNVISCGSYTGTGSPLSVTLGYEPQWILAKRVTGSAFNGWPIMDTMRGMSLTGVNWTFANTSGAEADAGLQCNPTATGFTITSTGSNLNAGGSTYIYVAIRRGPMKTPTVGTSVFSPVAQVNPGSRPFPVTAGFPVDSAWFGQRSGWGVNFITSDRLRGATNLLLTTSTNTEATNNSTYGPSTSRLDSNTQFFDGITNTGEPDIYWMFKRAPSFFDEVCYTGAGAGTVTHNLGVVPELIIVKGRTNTGYWTVYSSSVGATKYLLLNDTGAPSTNSFMWNNTTPTSTVFSVGGQAFTSGSGVNYVAYLFATCAGVSKVGSYTGTGALQTINCGFTSGARFVLIKNASDVGNWYVYDSARGITSGDDPYLFINSTSVEVNNTNFIDTDTTGFKVTAAAPAGLNFSGDTYIFLAIA
jgi:hypothetical protein